MSWAGDTKPDILFLSDYARFDDNERGTFKGGAGAAFLQLLNLVLRKFPKYHSIHTLKYRMGYVLQCSTDDKENKIKPTVTDCGLCDSMRVPQIVASSPKLIVTMGKLATNGLGVGEKNFDNVRGKMQKVILQGQEFAVYPTFHPAAIYGGTGLTKIFMADLEKILFTCLEGNVSVDAISIKKRITSYEFPKTLFELSHLVDRAIKYKGDSYPLAVDTETNSLKPWLPTSKCIAFSFAWDEGKSAAILLNHKSQDPLKWWLYLPYIFKLLLCDKPKIAHNFQFDLNVFRMLYSQAKYLCDTFKGYRYYLEKVIHPYKLPEDPYSYPINNVSWDTMIGEHTLEEDKRGFYGLKNIIRKYVPDFVGYEAQLKANSEDPLLSLRTFNDFFNLVASSEEAVTKQEQQSTFSGWSALWMPEYTIPSQFNKYSQYSVYDAAYLITKSSHKKKWQKTAKELLGENYEKITKSNEIPENLRDNEDINNLKWYYALKKLEKKDPLKDWIKKVAKELRDTTEKEKDEINFENFPVEELLTYAAIDTDMTIRSALCQIKELNTEEKQQPSVVYADCEETKIKSVYAMKTISNPTTILLSNMTNTGITIDTDYMSWLQNRYTEIAQQSSEELLSKYEEALGSKPYDLNLNSNNSLGSMLIDMGYDMQERSATGQIKVTKDILKRLDPKEVPKLILRYREALKGRDTFLKNFAEYSSDDGRVHASFHQIGTATYRLSSSRPNNQNTPVKLAGENIKKVMIPSSRDKILVNIDAAGAEIKTLTAYMNQMKGEFRGQGLISEMNADPDFDLHSKFCAFVFGKEFSLDCSTPEKWNESYLWVRHYKDIDSKVNGARKKIKAVVFGTLYGQTAHGLSQLIGIPLEEAEFIIEMFFAAEPSIKNYVEWSQKFVEKNGYITTIFGRRRRFPLAKLDRKQMSRAKRQATNFLIQSTTVDLFNKLLSIAGPVIVNELQGAVLMQVHDAIVFEMPKKHINKLEAFSTKYMREKTAELFKWFPVPFVCDVAVGDNYGEMVSVSKYLENNFELSEALQEEQQEEIDMRSKLTQAEDPDEAHEIDDVIMGE